MDFARMKIVVHRHANANNPFKGCLLGGPYFFGFFSTDLKVFFFLGRKKIDIFQK